MNLNLPSPNTNNSKLFVINNFYDNPDEVRYSALLKKTKTNSYHPGERTEPIINDETKEKLENILKTEITPYGDSGCFQFNKPGDSSWIHTDVTGKTLLNNTNKLYWASVVYLTPDPPIDGGTLILSNKHVMRNAITIYDIYNNDRTLKEANEIEQKIKYNVVLDNSEWNKEIIIGNVYNRCVIYNAEFFHISHKYFGNTIENCRLIQVFFFMTNKN